MRSIRRAPISTVSRRWSVSPCSSISVTSWPVSTPPGLSRVTEVLHSEDWTRHFGKPRPICNATTSIFSPGSTKTSPPPQCGVPNRSIFFPGQSTMVCSACGTAKAPGWTAAWMSSGMPMLSVPRSTAACSRLPVMITLASLQLSRIKPSTCSSAFRCRCSIRRTCRRCSTGGIRLGAFALQRLLGCAQGHHREHGLINFGSD